MLEARQLYYEERSRANQKLVESVGGALSAVVMAVGVNLSNRYRRYTAEGFKVMVQEGKALDRWDRMVLSVMPKADQAYVYIGGNTEKGGTK
jgi:hypothetical protein